MRIGTVLRLEVRIMVVVDDKETRCLNTFACSRLSRLTSCPEYVNVFKISTSDYNKLQIIIEIDCGALDMKDTIKVCEQSDLAVTIGKQIHRMTSPLTNARSIAREVLNPLIVLASL